MANKGDKDIKPGPGRPKGSKDKIARNVKDRVMQVWNELEADGKGLRETAEGEPAWFYANFVKPMLPKDIVVSGDGDNPLVNRIEFTLVRPEDS